MIRQWDKDAFWETPKKTVLNCISEQEEGNKKIRQVHKLVDSDPLFKECVDALTPCLLYTSPSPRDRQKSRMPSSA